MQNKKRILILGEVYTDNHIDLQAIRLGGIFHSARTLDALNADYALAAILPQYLNQDFETFSSELNANAYIRIGEIQRSPNLINIQDSKEIGDLGYEDILREQAETILDTNRFIKLFEEYRPTDLLIYPGKYDLISLLNSIHINNINIHIDFQYQENLIHELLNHNITIETLILSTTSKAFLDIGGSVFNLMNSNLADSCSYILLKENRGGSTLIDVVKQLIHETPSFNILNTHSVGVGDSFNSAYVFNNKLIKIEHCLKIASYLAKEYASTFSHVEFKNTVSLIENDILKMSGVRIPWEERQKIHIYIAGPDFPSQDREFFDEIEKTLKYHNFVPHRPIKENGLYTGEESYREQQIMYNKDIELLKKCDLMIAILVDEDPGTFVEIGWMKHAGKPILLFDPYKKAFNLFLKKSVTNIVYTLDEVLFEVYNLCNRSVEKTPVNYDVLLLMSGGLDSTTLAYDLLTQNKTVLPIFLDYGQHFKDRELESLLKVIPRPLKSHLRIINIRDIFEYSSSKMINEPNLWLDNINSDDLYLPYRNLLFLSIASSIAQSLKIKEVYAAFINSNHAKEIDCSKEFFDNLGSLLKEYGTVDIQLPYRELNKTDVINKGIKLKVPMALTYSCQANSQVPCGICPNCVDRESAISSAFPYNKN
ncbi:7-cyano-7-deazaguanine synthase [Ornithinibacillus sp. 179-J 7C1 HS]|uniref:7-cyano-7-deazaguanine synthase n=1 Tax=Ornithinibacillus sp. 179-J 7C1 HS TaxID=3142384 RepID=UPI0039A1523D